MNKVAEDVFIVIGPTHVSDVLSLYSLQSKISLYARFRMVMHAVT